MFCVLPFRKFCEKLLSYKDFLSVRYEIEAWYVAQKNMIYLASVAYDEF